MNYSHKIVMVGDGTNTGTNLTDLAQGDLLFLDKDFAAITSANAGLAGVTDDAIYIASKTSKKAVISTPIKRSQVVSVAFNEYSAAAQKVQYIGYNGTAGDFVSDTGAFSTASKTFAVNFVVKEDYRTLPMKDLNVSSAYQTALSGSTNVEVISYIYRNFVKNALLAASSPLQVAKVEMISSGAGTVLGSSSTLSVVKGSRIITASNTSHGLVAGNIVRIGATALTTGVYMVESVSGATITLESPYQGATAATVSNANSLKVANTPGTESLGLKFTALALNMASKWENYAMMDFNLYPQYGFTKATLVTTATAKSPGIGVGRYVYGEELKFYSAENPAVNFRDFPQDELALNASTTGIYDMLVIRYNKSAEDNFMQSSAKIFPQTIVIAMPNGTDQSDDGTANTFLNKIANWISKDSTGAVVAMTEIL